MVVLSFNLNSLNYIKNNGDNQEIEIFRGCFLFLNLIKADGLGEMLNFNIS